MGQVSCSRLATVWSDAGKDCSEASCAAVAPGRAGAALRWAAAARMSINTFLSCAQASRQRMAWQASCAPRAEAPDRDAACMLSACAQAAMMSVLNADCSSADPSFFASQVSRPIRYAYSAISGSKLLFHAQTTSAGDMSTRDLLLAMNLACAPSQQKQLAQSLLAMLVSCCVDNVYWTCTWQWRRLAQHAGLPQHTARTPALRHSPAGLPAQA